MIRTDLGAVTAYAIAVAHGYTGTEAEFADEIANAAVNAQSAANSANSAANSASDASESASDAAASAENAASEATAAAIEAVSNMIDNTLSISGKAADAGVTGSSFLTSILHKGNITTSGLDLNSGDFIHPGMWSLIDPAIKPSHYPSQLGGRIISFASSSDSSITTLQVVVDYNSKLYFRYSNSNDQWGEWQQINDLSSVLMHKGNITTSGLDLNSGDFIHPGMWSLIDPAIKPSHYPSQLGGRIISFASSSDSSITTLQVVVDYNSEIYYRYSYSTGQWGSWQSLDLLNVLKNKGNITTSGLDLNSGDFIHPGMWSIADASYIPDNWPSDAIGRLVIFTSSSDSSFATLQIVCDYRSDLFYRYSDLNGSWKSWKKIAKDEEVAKSNVTVLYKGLLEDPLLNINTGDFKKPGIWKLADVTKMPKNWPTSLQGQLVSFSSESDSSFATIQYVMDRYNGIYMRYSREDGNWNDWVNLRSGFQTHRDAAFKPIFTNFSRFQNDYNIPVHTAGETNKVSKMYALYDSETANGITITKESFGKDSSGLYDIYRYTVSKNTGEKPIVLVIMGEHGNERPSAMVGYYLYREVVHGVLTQYLDYVDFVFIPLMVPWGYENNSRNNYNGVNINRDFPAFWSYNNDGHNTTGNVSMSQVETNYIINYVFENKNKILFAVNKHDTGSISRKINGTESDLVAYLSSNMVTDRVINNGICNQQNAQVRGTDPWIITECISYDISKDNLIPSVSWILPGSMDLFFNSIGIHASLLEVAYRSFDSNDDPPRYSDAHESDIRRLGLDFFVNYIASSIEHCDMLLSNDETVQQTQRYYSRKLVDGEYQNIELSLNRYTNTFVEA